MCRWIFKTECSPNTVPVAKKCSQVFLKLKPKSRCSRSDALMAEIQHFVSCIRTGATPLVSGIAGRRALATAIKIGELLSEKTRIQNS